MRIENERAQKTHPHRNLNNSTKMLFEDLNDDLYLKASKFKELKTDFYLKATYY